jgi:hypothetical protein
MYHLYAMKRTTIALDEDLLKDLKKRAADESVSVQALINGLLRGVLRAAPREPYHLVLKGWKAAPQPGVDLFDRDALFDLLDER